MPTKALVLTGYGINCDEETQFALMRGFEKAGGIAERVHINSLINKSNKLTDYQILVFPGGFSYGDDTGAGLAFANRVRNHLWNDVREFVEQDKLVLGICNGFQVLANLGLVPALDKKYGEPQVALIHNDSARYIDRWVDLKISGNSPWTSGIEKLSVPIAHGEGKFYASTEILEDINGRGLVAARYFEGPMCRYQSLGANPNGSLENIAAISDETGRILGMMPHPERAIDITQYPNWPLLKEVSKRKKEQMTEEGEGMKIFRNGVEYFS